MRSAWLLALLAGYCALSPPVVAQSPSPSKVTFDERGIAQFNGKPFFPVGMFLYSLDEAVLAELRDVQCNTVVNGFRVDQLDLIHANDLKAICHTDQATIDAAESHPALLAWYLTDEPENRGVTAASERERYLALKAQDPDHPIGQCHTAHHALTTFKDSCDFTMTDIYPITPKRDQNIMGVSLMMDEARRLHGENWPHWIDIQTFGGPETDHGVWAVPLPHELRFMVYQALVHRATGVLYFSYWPQAPRTWEEVGRVNRELHRLIPFLVAPGREGAAKADDPRVEVRVKLAEEAERVVGGVLIAINTSPTFVQSAIKFDDAALRPTEPKPVYDGGLATDAEGNFVGQLAPYGVHVVAWGRPPQE